MNIKMILTDLDGTLICSDGSISERTKLVLKQCQNYGIFIVIATARYWIGAERYIDEIQPDYEITTDGTLIHRHGEQIYSCNLEIEDTNQIVHDILARDDKTEITVATGRQVFWNSKHISESEKLHKAVYCDYQKPLSLFLDSEPVEIAGGDRIGEGRADSKVAGGLWERVRTSRHYLSKISNFGTLFVPKRHNVPLAFAINPLAGNVPEVLTLVQRPPATLLSARPSPIRSPPATALPIKRRTPSMEILL